MLLLVIATGIYYFPVIMIYAGAILVIAGIGFIVYLKIDDFRYRLRLLHGDDAWERFFAENAKQGNRIQILGPGEADRLS